MYRDFYRIKESPLSAYALAKKYSISQTTALRWKKRGDLEDRSSRPHRLRTTLTPQQEERILFERKQFKKTIEDIFFTLEGEIPNFYLMKIYRVLKRYELYKDFKDCPWRTVLGGLGWLRCLIRMKKPRFQCFFF